MHSLKKFLKHRGALSAAALHLTVRPATVLRWKRGEWKPSEQAQQRIDAMISTMIFDVSEKKLKKVTHFLSEEEPPRKSHNVKFAAK